MIRAFTYAAFGAFMLSILHDLDAIFVWAMWMIVFGKEALT